MREHEQNPAHTTRPRLTSSTACIIGASIIWIDLLICYIPGKSDFNIQESNVFLASALSLSFGVMVSLSMVPPCHTY